MYNLAIFNYKKIQHGTEAKLAECSVKPINGWVIDKVTDNYIQSLSYDLNTNSTKIYSISKFHPEEVQPFIKSKRCSVTQISNQRVCGLIKKRDNNMFDHIYFVMDLNIKISAANLDKDFSSQVAHIIDNTRCP